MTDNKLRLEVWEDFSDDGMMLPALLYAGPRGEESRRQLGPKARLVQLISAGSYFEAMTIYYQLLGWGDYTTSEPWDHQPYPPEWIVEQQRALIHVPGETVRHPPMSRPE
jgi:hypothetical protein